MSYCRVIPRDLFNEANLMKCMGAAFICAETTPGVEVIHLSDGEEPFHIVMNEDDGSIAISNVKITVHGETIETFRPMSSRESYPLMMVDENCDVISIFNENGVFSRGFLEYVQEQAPSKTIDRSSPEP